jgi:hypothetical protein
MPITNHTYDRGSGEIAYTLAEGGGESLDRAATPPKRCRG